MLLIYNIDSIDNNSPDAARKPSEMREEEEFCVNFSDDVKKIYKKT